MGYRSDVRIMTTQKGFDKLKKFADEYLKDKKTEDINLLNNCDIMQQNNFVKYFGWNAVKWYEHFDEVKAIMEGLAYLEEKNMSFSYSRLGEDIDDYETSIYESENEEKLNIVSPCVCRYFNDDLVLEDLNEFDDELNL